MATGDSGTPNDSTSIPDDYSEIEFEKHSPEHDHSDKPQQRSPADSEKAVRILKACRDRDLEMLRKLAISPHGLVDDALRKAAWPLLLGVMSEQQADHSDWKHLGRHKDEEQVHLDVHRSFVYYPEDETEAEKNEHKRELNQVITAVLRRHPMLHYFQGYHDIVQVLLLVLGANECIPSVERLSLLRIRDFMLPTMSGTEHHLRLLPSILYAADPEVCQHLSKTQPFFALAATLTLYAHDIEEYGDISRLFDFLLASEAVVSLYLFAVIVISRKKELLQIEPEEPEMLHAILSKLPKPLDLEGLIGSTTTLFEQHPPEKLPARVWSRVSSSSVLKTTHNVISLAHRSLEDGERLFAEEAAEILRVEERERRRKNMRLLVRRYRQPVAYTGVAVLIAIFALVARSRGGQSAIQEAVPVAGRLISMVRRAASSILTTLSP